MPLKNSNKRNLLCGYRVVRKQEVIRRGVALTNLVMEKRSERTR
ncbi:hypothetical protein [Oscillospiraceae bacterium]|nr:hypothetical protein [Oscillospiraceae bacterium]